ncbi:flagellar assembly protein FliX [Falsiroseomonas stagni]|uniref:Class II flagellar assembly regulator n=1 Tax=Falsiroseomonas stagni DSM 19981 TaxID=1123062 RepID=A0A1I4CIC5_9PROT|nr:flagellar assembly protein FliX [Falsiroseomonas stagni]SFK80029.1 Class II flagellar assembly regulator [Falsiroseomonas stagni DSM 19981]
MSVGPVRPGAMGAVGRGRVRAGAGGFALAAAGGDSAEAAGAAGAAAPPGSLLALQESGAAPPVEERGARARRQATEALDDLRGLQLALLDGSANPAGLERLSRLGSENQAGLDPPLATLMAELAVRARVELARRGRR